MKATFAWSRQDSYISSTATTLTNTNTSGVILDASLSLNLGDNQRTYVFALSNGKDGIQINHFQTAGTNLTPTTYKSAGVGSNTLSSPTALYDKFNWCTTNNLHLAGTYDASVLSSAITAYSDGYVATSTLGLETFMGGAAGSW